jgi:hypothetical protein
MLGGSFLSNVGGDMKTEIKVEELKQLMPSKRETTYLQVLGLLIFMAAFLFCRDNIIHPILLMAGVMALTRGFEKIRLQNKLKQIME